MDNNVKPGTIIDIAARLKGSFAEFMVSFLPGNRSLIFLKVTYLGSDECAPIVRYEEDRWRTR